MEMKKIFDIATIPSDMALFFRNFVDEFEKTLFGGGSAPILMFFEDGPRDGYATTFKSVGDYYQNYIARVQFQVEGTKMEVLLGCESQYTGPDARIKKGIMKRFSTHLLDTGFAKYVEAATKKALRETREMTN